MALNIQNALSNWNNLNEALRAASELDCVALLEAEKKTQRRLSFLLRVYGRFNSLRSRREREELVGRTA